jgi:flagellar motor switch protein FliG
MSKDETIAVDGPRVAAAILNQLPREARTRIVEAMRLEAPEAAQRIEHILLHELKGKAAGPSKSIEKIIDLTDKDVQKMIRQVDSRDLAVTLSSAPKEAKEKVFKNLSESRKQQVIEEIYELPPSTPAEVEAANAKILKTIDDLYPTGEIQQPEQKRLRSRLA